MTTKKKSFKDSPALQFISNQGAEAQDTDNTPNTPDAQNTPNTPAKENHNRRLNLSLQPSVVADIQKIAFMQHSTLNAAINKILKTYAADHRETIERYEEIFKEEEHNE